MEFDFHQQFKDRPTPELLHITMHPGQYQPAAVAAASAILEARAVSPEDIAEAEENLVAEEHATLQTGSIARGFRALANKLGKWRMIILAIATLQLLQLLYIDIKMIDTVLNCKDCPFRMVSILSYFDLVFVPVVLFLFYRGKKSGWILLTGTKFFTSISTVIYYFRDYLPHPGFSPLPMFIFGLAFDVVVLLLLWKQEVKTSMGITSRVAWLTLACTLGLFIVLLFPGVLSLIV